MLYFKNPRFALIILITFTKCSISQNSKYINSGIVIYSPKYFDTTTKQFKYPKNEKPGRVWFKDSLIIYEELETVINENGITNTKTYTFELLDFIFFDLKTGNEYHYPSFSDTAKLIKSNFQSKDSSESNLWLIFGYTPKEFNIPDSTVVLLSDTTIGQYKYKRFSGFNYANSEHNRAYTYFCCCNSFNPIFQIRSVESKKFCNGLPIQRQEFYGNGAHKTKFVAEFELLQSGLTPEEEKVFNAWEKYAKEHPIKQK